MFIIDSVYPVLGPVLSYPCTLTSELLALAKPPLALESLNFLPHPFHRRGEAEEKVIP